MKLTNLFVESRYGSSLQCRRDKSTVDSTSTRFKGCRNTNVVSSSQRIKETETHADDVPVFGVRRNSSKLRNGVDPNGGRQGARTTSQARAPLRRHADRASRINGDRHGSADFTPALIHSQPLHARQCEVLGARTRHAGSCITLVFCTATAAPKAFRRVAM